MEVDEDGSMESTGRESERDDQAMDRDDCHVEEGRWPSPRASDDDERGDRRDK